VGEVKKAVILDARDRSRFRVCDRQMGSNGFVF